MDFDKVREIIANQLDIDPETITAESSLIDDLKADSLDLVELIMDIEQEYDIEIPDSVFPNIKTVGDIVTYLGKR